MAGFHMKCNTRLKMVEIYPITHDTKPRHITCYQQTK